MEDTQNPQGDQSAQPADQGGQPTPPPADPAGGAQPPADQSTKTPKDEKNLSGIMEENVDISSLVANAGNAQQVQDFVAKIKVPPHPNTKFDDQKFVQLLAGSISLTNTEKERIVGAIPQLSQFQVDELMKIFEEEQQKFTELEKKHADQLSELEKKHASNPEAEKAKVEEEAQKGKEESEAEDIKKSLGL